MNNQAPVITRDRLLGRDWRFYHANGVVASEALRFLPDGGIGGYTHPNEHSWRLEQGELCFAREDGTVTTRFTEVKRQAGGLLLRGPFLENPSIILCLSHGMSKVEEPAPNALNGETRLALASRITAFGWSIGEHSYGIPALFEDGMAKLTIGRYCSIAQGSAIALGNHRIDTVSSYPFAALRNRWPGVPPGVSDHATRGDVVLGNDVWLGVYSFVGSGVTIGDGAVVGAHAVVTRDVPPYAVVAGNPSRVVRSRFPADIVARLLRIAWWNWPDHTVDAYLPTMMSADIEAFCAAAEADPMLRPRRPPP